MKDQSDLAAIRKRDSAYQLERWSNWVAHDRRELLRIVDELQVATDIAMAAQHRMSFQFDELTAELKRRTETCATYADQRDAYAVQVLALQSWKEGTLEVLRRAENSLGSFCSDEGWDQKDMDTMDDVSAILARLDSVKPQPLKESVWRGVTEGVRTGYIDPAPLTCQHPPEAKNNAGECQFCDLPQPLPGEPT